MKLAINFAADGVLPQCRVLVVGHDAETVSKYYECATSLGYDIDAAQTPAEALQRLAQDHNIGVVIVDLEMPVGGLAFLDELGARFSLLRPVVPIAVSADDSLANVVEAMRTNARDFLTKPVGADVLSGALRRATRAWQDLYAGFRLAAAVRRDAPATPIGDAPAPPPAAADEREGLLAQ
ncbi:MAG: response regulator, partial [Rhizorhabdus sp.]